MTSRSRCVRWPSVSPTSSQRDEPGRGARHVYRQQDADQTAGQQGMTQTSSLQDKARYLSGRSCPTPPSSARPLADLCGRLARPQAEHPVFFQYLEAAEREHETMSPDAWHNVCTTLSPKRSSFPHFIRVEAADGAMPPADDACRREARRRARLRVAPALAVDRLFGLILT